MTVPNNKMKESFNGDGVTVLFPFTGISFYQVADLDVLIADVNGVETVLTQNTDYTITNCGTGMPYTYGDVTMIGYYALHPPATGETVVVYRDVPYTQEIDLAAGGAMPAATLEEGYDRGIMQIQQLFDLIGRTVTLPISSPLSGLTLPAPVAEYFLRWNALANNLENFNIADLSLYSVSAFAETLLDDTDAATARATLGVTLANLGLDADLATFSVPASTTISAFGKTLVDDADAAAAQTTLGISSFIKTLLDDADAATARATLVIPFPQGHISGLTLSHAADTDHDITIAAGSARDSTNAYDLILASALTKQADASWAVGTNAGGFDTGAIPATGTIHVWLIKRSDTGVVDALFSISATAPTMPASYDSKRLIGSYRTNGSNNIINGDWWGTGLHRTFMYDTPILDVSNATPGTSAVTAALSTPAGLNVFALLHGTGAATVAAYVSALDNADMAPSITVAPLFNLGQNTGTSIPGTTQRVKTDTSSQIRYRCLSNVAIYITTMGWEQPL